MPDDPLPTIGLGTYSNDDREECADTVAMALDLGYRHVDTAQMYGNEAHVGDGLENATVPREEVSVATKVKPENLAHGDVLDSARESRDRLGVSTIDLLYVHWPTGAYDPDETLPALDELVDDGAVRRVGLSNFTPDLLDEARETLDAPIFAHQVEMHPFLHQEELQEYAVEHDHWLVAYSPLAKGDALDDDVLREIADDHGATPAQVSIAWLAAKENVVPIPKATGPHVEENFEARDLALTEEDVERIDDIDTRRRVVDPDRAPWNR